MGADPASQLAMSRLQGLNDQDLKQAVGAMVQLLAPHELADWDVPAGSLAWSCRETAAHVAHDLAAYAAQLAARGSGSYLPLDLLVRPGATTRQLLAVVAACGSLLGEAVSTAGPDARAWHWGLTDASGFAALGLNEVLVHTYDIAQGLRIAWLPSERLCAGVVARLFPDAPEGDPVRTLLWCTGRVDLPDLPRPDSWLPRAAG